MGRQINFATLCDVAYLANGWSFALFNRRMVDELFQARLGGPVLPGVYRSFARYGGAVIADCAPTACEDQLRREDAEIVEAVATCEGAERQALVRGPHGPWSLTLARKGEFGRIDDRLIRRQFLALRKSRGS